jgi:hypothetical protein
LPGWGPTSNVSTASGASQWYLHKNFEKFYGVSQGGQGLGISAADAEQMDCQNYSGDGDRTYLDLVPATRTATQEVNKANYCSEIALAAQGGSRIKIGGM